MPQLVRTENRHDGEGVSKAVPKVVPCQNGGGAGGEEEQRRQPTAQVRAVPGVGVGQGGQRLRRFFPGLKRMVLPGGIFTSVPVRGLRPSPFLRGLT